MDAPLIGLAVRIPSRRFDCLRNPVLDIAKPRAPSANVTFLDRKLGNKVTAQTLVTSEIAEKRPLNTERAMNQVIYLIGLIVVVMAILSFLGLR